MKEVNPNEDDFMHALALELQYITIGVNNLLENGEIIIASHINGSFRVVVEFCKSLSVTELGVIRNKVRRDSELNELLPDRL